MSGEQPPDVLTSSEAPSGRERDAELPPPPSGAPPLTERRGGTEPKRRAASLARPPGSTPVRMSLPIPDATPPRPLHDDVAKADAAPPTERMPELHEMQRAQNPALSKPGPTEPPSSEPVSVEPLSIDPEPAEDGVEASLAKAYADPAPVISRFPSPVPPRTTSTSVVPSARPDGSPRRRSRRTVNASPESGRPSVPPPFASFGGDAEAKGPDGPLSMRDPSGPPEVIRPMRIINVEGRVSSPSVLPPPPVVGPPRERPSAPEVEAVELEALEDDELHGHGEDAAVDVLAGTSARDLTAAESPSIPPKKVPPPPPKRLSSDGMSLPPGSISVTPPPPLAETRPRAPMPEATPKRTRPWWEEIFSEELSRAMDKPDAKLAKKECDFIEERLGLSQGAVILDLGCGAGLHTVELASRGYSMVGYDLSLAMLARAAEEAQDRAQKLNFLHGDMREMSFEDTFDGIYCWGTSFGYFDDEKNLNVLTRMRRALREGGMLLLDVANHDYITARQPSLVWFEGDGCVCMDEMFVDFFSSRLRVKRTVMFEDGRSREVDYSIRLYSLHELGKMLHDTGFKVVEVTGHLAHPGVFFGAESPRITVLAERA